MYSFFTRIICITPIKNHNKIALIKIDFEKASKINIILLIIFDISIPILIGLMERKVKLFKMIFRPTNFYIDIKNKSRKDLQNLVNHVELK